MKKIFCLIAVLALLSGCDDGDMSFKTFDFSGQSSQSCTDNNVYFKINDTEVLVLELSPSALANVPTQDPDTGEQVPVIVNVTVGGSNAITYRNYNGTVTSSIFCSNPAPATPGVVEEWLGDGTLSIITTEVRDSNERLTGYVHQITIQSVTFKKGEESITINDNLFGAITSSIGFVFDFVETQGQDPVVNKCEDNDLLYNMRLKESLILSFPGFTFPTEAGTTTIPLEGLGNVNDVIFTVYDGNISDSHVCDVIKPITPVARQHWEAASGDVIIVTTIGEANEKNHKIYLKDVIFENSAQETFSIYDIVTVEDEALGYVFGTYTTE
jgi:hypothetical protein